MNEMQIFNSEKFGSIRAVEIEGEPWFCLADVCNPLGLEAKGCRRRLKEGGVLTTHLADSSGRQNQMLIINEPNLYRTIFQSKKQEAEAFIDWITEEVLPTLRKHGTYSIVSTAPHRPPEVSPGGLARLILANRRIMLEGGSSPQDVQAVTKSIYETWCIPVPETFLRQIPGQLCLYNLRPKDETT